MDLDRIDAVVKALRAANVMGKTPFDAQHDVLYIPWFEKTGETAEALKAAGCHWSSEGECWASY